MDARIIVEDEKLYDLCAFLFKRWTAGIYELKLNIYTGNHGLQDRENQSSAVLFI